MRNIHESLQIKNPRQKKAPAAEPRVEIKKKELPKKTDERFAGLQSNPDFEIDENDERANLRKEANVID